MRSSTSAPSGTMSVDPPDPSHQEPPYHPDGAGVPASPGSSLNGPPGCPPAEPGGTHDQPAPHLLTLTSWAQTRHDEDTGPGWDEAEITCPYLTATAVMPCAMWIPCGCADTDLRDGVGLCPRSTTGQHRYISGDPHKPTAECWATYHEDQIAERAFELGLGPGLHQVQPWWDGDKIQLDLTDQSAVTR